MFIKHLLCAGHFYFFVLPTIALGGESCCPYFIDKETEALRNHLISGCQQSVLELGSQTRFCLISNPHFFLDGPCLPVV